MARREGKASRAIHEEVSTLIKEGRYGYAPRKKPENSFRLMFENFNSLGVFTGRARFAGLITCLASMK